MTADDLRWLEAFYTRLCDGDWEHAYGFHIGNLDNPGWSIDFDIADTKLEQSQFVSLKEERSERDWIFCTVRDRKFVGRGGPGNLGELLHIFRNWAEASIGPEESPWADEAA